MKDRKYPYSKKDRGELKTMYKGKLDTAYAFQRYLMLVRKESVLKVGREETPLLQEWEKNLDDVITTNIDLAPTECMNDGTPDTVKHDFLASGKASICGI
jgi:hypothetical protein